MNNKLIERLRTLEAMKEQRDIPDLIIVSEEGNGFSIMEQYCKHDKNGNIITGSGEEKIIHVDHRDEYKTPEGFKGVLIDGIVYE